MLEEQHDELVKTHQEVKQMKNIAKEHAS